MTTENDHREARRHLAAPALPPHSPPGRLAAYDCLCRSRHGVTTQWAKLSEVDQDTLDAKLLARVLRSDGMTAKEAAAVDWKAL